MPPRGALLGWAGAGALPNLPPRPGSLLCHGDVLFQPPAPTSLEVLEALALSVGPDEALAGSNFQVDPYSIAVGGKLPLGQELGGSMAPQEGADHWLCSRGRLGAPPCPQLS